MKVYHYTRMEDWLRILREAKAKNTKPALTPRRNMGHEDDRAWETRAVYGLLDAEPADWKDNKDYPRVWKALQNAIGEMLIEIEVAENEPGVFVADWGHKEEYLSKPTHDDRATDAERRREAESAYFDSKIPLKDYLARKEVLHYSVPEVIITKKVPFSKIHISEKQPLLELRLQEVKDVLGLLSLKREYEGYIKQIPELHNWFKDFKAREAAEEAQHEIKLEMRRSRRQ